MSRRFQWECLIEYTTKFDAHTHTSIWIHDHQVKLKWMCQFEWENTLFQSECETTIIKILNTCCCYSDEIQINEIGFCTNKETQCSSFKLL